MDLAYLKVFRDLGQLASFSKAAEKNHLSQSAVSQIVDLLEKRLGVDLVDRSERPLKLTAPGRTFAEGCQSLLDQYGELKAAVRNEHDQLEATVRVAAIYSVGLGDMGEYIERFSAQHPLAKVEIAYLHPNRVYERLQNGSADVGLVSFPRKSRKFEIIPWREEEMVLVCSPNHPLAAMRSVRPIDLADQAYVGFDQHLVIRKKVDRFLREHGVSVDVSIEFDNIETIKKAIEVGAGVALLPEPTVRREVEGGSLIAVHLTGTRLVRPLGIVHRRGRRLGSMARRFIALLTNTEPDSASTSTQEVPKRSPLRSRRQAKAAAHGRNGTQTNSTR